MLTSQERDQLLHLLRRTLTSCDCLESFLKMDSLFKHSASQFSEIYARLSRLEENIRQLMENRDDVDDRLAIIEHTMCHNKMHLVEPENTNKKFRKESEKRNERIKELQKELQREA